MYIDRTALYPDFDYHEGETDAGKELRRICRSVLLGLLAPAALASSDASFEERVLWEAVATKADQYIDQTTLCPDFVYHEGATDAGEELRRRCRSVLLGLLAPAALASSDASFEEEVLWEAVATKADQYIGRTTLLSLIHI